MRERPCILVVDDVLANIEIVQMRLESQGYDIVTAEDGEEALAKVESRGPDLILIDIMMPKLDGIEVTRRLKADEATRHIPIILLTAKSDAADVVRGLEAGGDDYLTKPFDHSALVARVRAMLRTKALHDLSRAQASTLSGQAAELARLNETLEARVATQVAELERLGRLRRFLSPQVAELIANEGEGALQSHRREITVVFCDLRGFTAFTDHAEPEDVMEVLRAYHKAIGTIVYRHQGVLERFAGDGILTLFNDPVPCPDHPQRAVRMALEMRQSMQGLTQAWKRQGRDLGYGIGIAIGYATLGQIGFDGRQEYAAIGSVTNLASRLCDEARSGQIVVSRALLGRVDDLVEADSLGDLQLKGFQRPIAGYDITGWRQPAADAGFDPSPPPDPGVGPA